MSARVKRLKGRKWQRKLLDGTDPSHATCLSAPNPEELAFKGAISLFTFYDSFSEKKKKSIRLRILFMTKAKPSRGQWGGNGSNEIPAMDNNSEETSHTKVKVHKPSPQCRSPQGLQRKVRSKKDKYVGCLQEKAQDREGPSFLSHYTSKSLSLESYEGSTMGTKTDLNKYILRRTLLNHLFVRKRLKTFV